ncbi:hypothetical protein BX600DRAFT_556119 [Xylariales sp. PMI_506]|nr:hypothetical protein BX600DRAFT_556119 [Xylariales sp. PMI_506]
MPKLRTKTGCLTCRTRRKKCDETHDRCLGCLRNHLQCVWPTKDQEKDRRNLPRYQQRSRHQAVAATSIRPLAQAHKFIDDDSTAPRSFPLVEYGGPETAVQLDMFPNSTEESISTVLLAAFMHEFLPGRIHPHCRPHFFQFSYTYEVAPQWPALLNACLACAAGAIGARLGISPARTGADQFYGRSVRALRTAIEDGSCDGSEDWLLATVVILCLYENHKPAYSPASAAIHVAAAGRIFRLRALRRTDSAFPISGRGLSRGKSWSALVLERIFVESFLYQSMVISIRYRNLTPLQDPLLRGVFDTYFAQSELPVSPEPENWPVLGMHYEIIRLISDLVAHLDRREQADVDADDSPDLENLLKQLDIWKNDAVLHGYGLHILLYISAAKLLAYRHLSGSSLPISAHYSILAQHELDCCISTLAAVDFTAQIRRYLYWPLGIIDKLTLDPLASQVVQQKLGDAARMEPAGKKAYDWVAEGFQQRYSRYCDR